MKRSNSANSSVHGDSSKRQKTEIELNNHRLSQNRPLLNSQSPRIGFGHLNGGRGAGFPSNFSEDVLPSNLNVWSAFCRNSTLTNSSPWNLIPNDNQQQQQQQAFPRAGCNIDHLFKELSQFFTRKTSDVFVSLLFKLRHLQTVG